MTLLSSRPTRNNLAIEYQQWFRQALKPTKKGLKHHYQFTPFYSLSVQSHEQGSYFGIGNGTKSYTVGNTGVDPVSPNAYQEVDGGLLLHDTGIIAAPPTTAQSTVSLSPEQQSYGVHMVYLYEPEKPIPGLLFKIHLPIEQQRRKIGAKFDNKIKLANTNFSIEDYLKGRVLIEPSATSGQTALSKLKFSGHRDHTGISDMSVSLGYKLSQGEYFQTYVSAGVIIPTGSKPQANYLFDAVIGNGGHPGVQAELDSAMLLYDGEFGMLNVATATRLSYLFESTETRCPSIKGKVLSHYYLLGEKGKSNSPLTPAANILTQGFAVRPGCQFNTTLMLSYAYRALCIDAGYEGFWKDAEHVRTKEFKADQYGIAIKSHAPNAAAPFGVAQTVDRRFLSAQDLDLGSITTPALMTSKLYGGVCYRFCLPDLQPITLGGGVSYELPSSNADLEICTFWVKMSSSF